MKKAILIVFAIVCSAFYASAQQTSTGANHELPKLQTTSTKKAINWAPKYKGEVNVGYAITGERFLWDYEYSDSDGEFGNGTEGYRQTVLSRPLIETIHGVEIGPYFFLGAGVGVQYYCGKLKEFRECAEMAAEINQSGRPSDRWNAVMLPIFANLKFMYPVNDNFSPFLNLSLGGTVGCYSSINYKVIDPDADDEEVMKTRGGFYCDFGAGIRYKAFNFSLGLQHQAFAIGERYQSNDDGYYYEDQTLSTKVNAFYVKVGFNF